MDWFKASTKNVTASVTADGGDKTLGIPQHHPACDSSSGEVAGQESAAQPSSQAAAPDIALDPALGIPPFLQRNPDNTFAHPEPLSDGPGYQYDFGEDPKPYVLLLPLPSDLTGCTDPDLCAFMNRSDLTLVDRQPLYQELRRREDKKRSRDRIEKMLTKKHGQGNEDASSTS